MRIDFTKMHGVGNDFVVFDAPNGQSIPDTGRLRRLADRHTGIGFDQALVLEPPKRPGTAVFYRIFNSDGHEVEQCGNGARCIAALLARRGLASEGAVTMDSPAGLIQARVQGGERVSVDMGEPNFDPRSLPFDAPVRRPLQSEAGSERAVRHGSGQDGPAPNGPAPNGPADPYLLDVAGEQVEIGAVSMGNPHAVLLVDSVDQAPVERLGPAIEGHHRFPKRVNVGFMQIVSRSHVRLRVYERGAGETLACGTGACAAVAVGIRRGLLDPEVRVSVRGGELRVNWAGSGEHIWLTGPAEVSFEGHVEV